MLRVDIIDKSLVYKYQQEYVDYVEQTPMAFCPTIIGTYCCNISLAYCMCCCIICKRFGGQFTEVQGAKVNPSDSNAKTVSLLVNSKTDSQ